MPTLTIPQAFDLAMQHHQAGRLHEAEALYRQILAQQPDHAGALAYLGVMAYQAGQYNAAVDLLRRAIASAPHWPDAHNNLGNVLHAKGLWDQAIAAYRQALAIKPDYPEVHHNLGNALIDTGQMQAGIAALRRAIALQPSYAEAYSSLGTALKKAGCLDDAIALYGQAIALKPVYPKAYYNLGNALCNKGQLDQAIAAYRQAIALKPDWPEAHNNLGNVLQDTGRLYEAVTAFRQAIALQPNHAGAYCNLGNVLKDTGQLDRAIAAYRQALALQPDYPQVHSNILLCLHYHPGVDAATITRELGRWNQQYAVPGKTFIQTHTHDRDPGHRLRIGYVSADLRQHAVGQFLLPLLAHHDQQSFEVFGYAQVAAPDAMTAQLRSHTDGWRSLVGLSDAQAADLIRQDRIDILVDLGLHTANSRLLIFAYKPALVQVTYLAYAGSSGLDTMDYRLSDPYLDPFDTIQGRPPGTEESAYSEQTWRLPETYWCYQPTLELASPPAKLANGSITFGCLNNFCKVNKPLLSLWAAMLRAVPHSRLLLHAHEGDHRRRVLEYLQTAGIDPQRVSFMARVSRPAYFQQYASVAIALDTHPFGGGTTTCDALWMGVPVVSLAGKTAVSRAGWSILANAGLPELVAKTADEYVRIAVDLANDLPRLQALRSTLRQRMQTSPLMDAPRFARNIESAYRQMWQKWCAA